MFQLHINAAISQRSPPKTLCLLCYWQYITRSCRKFTLFVAHKAIWLIANCFGNFNKKQISFWYCKNFICISNNNLKITMIQELHWPSHKLLECEKMIVSKNRYGKLWGECLKVGWFCNKKFRVRDGSPKGSDSVTVRSRNWTDARRPCSCL